MVALKVPLSARDDGHSRRWKTDEKKFIAQMRESEDFAKALSSLSERVGKEAEELRSFGEQLCLCCWSEGVQAAAGESTVVAAAAEAQRLKKQMVDCQLTAAKQLGLGAFGDGSVIFHEPMKYLDQDMKDLVMMIVSDKVRQIQNGQAPSSLLQGVGAGGPSPGSGEKEKELQKELDVANAQLKEARAALEDARERCRDLTAKVAEVEKHAEQLQDLLSAAEARLSEADEMLAKAKAEHALLQTAHDELQAAHGELQASHGKLQVAHQELQESSAQQEEVIAKQQADMANMTGELEQLRKDVERMQEIVRRAEQLEREIKELQEKFSALEKEADEMRTELARRNNTRTKNAQTSLSGSELDEREEENKRLKVMIEELQMKIKELVEKCKEQGIGGHIAKLVADVGLECVIKEETVFERLYNDAFRRAQRTEQLRNKLLKERNTGFVREPAEAPEILEAVASNSRAAEKCPAGTESSPLPPLPDMGAPGGPLPGLRAPGGPLPELRLRETPHARELPSLPEAGYLPPLPGAAPRPPCSGDVALPSAGLPVMRRRQMRTVTSLPALHSAPPHDLGSKRHARVPWRAEPETGQDGGGRESRAELQPPMKVRHLL